MEEELIKVGITHGDINGIGYEVILKTFEEPEILELCTPIIYGSLKIASAYRKMLEMQQIPHQSIESAAQAQPGVVNIVNVIDQEVQAEPGKLTEAAGQAAFVALERATEELKEGLIDCLVTAPINKSNIQNEHFRFAGHTEYLQDRLAEEEDRALMIMVDPERSLRVALATAHLPISQVAGALNQELVQQKIADLSSALEKDFGVHCPRIAVLALNPHSGDGGLLGQEEEDFIMPAIEWARNEKILAYGPFAADGFFGAGHQSKFDGVLAMYHDQGLAPFKTISGSCGVNFTAGLPYVRTSPDHGTAMDIAGKGEADPQSFRQAIYCAIDALRCRARHAEAYSDPLKKLYQTRSSRD